MKIFYFISLFLVVICLGSSAQEADYRFINYNVKDGLPEKFVYSATQDQEGYMWFGTGTGLYRYDGYKFQKFRSNIDEPGRSISNVLTLVSTDKNGILWLGSLNCLQWYNPKKNLFTKPDFKKPSLATLANAGINGFQFDEEDYVWINTSQNRFFRFSRKDSSVESFGSFYPSGSSALCLKVVVIKNLVYAVHSEGIYQFEKNGKFKAFFKQIEGDISNAAYDSSSNRLLLCTYLNGVVSFDISTASFQRAPIWQSSLLQNNILSILVDGQKWWLGGYPFFVVDNDNKRVRNLVDTVKTDFSIEANKIGQIFQDREKNLWICSHSGLSMLPWQNSQINRIALFDSKLKSNIEPVGVFDLKQSKDLLVINTSTPGLVHIDYPSGKVNIISNPVNPDPYQKRIIGLIKAPDDKIFVSDDVNMFRYFPDEKRLEKVRILDQNGKDMIMVGRNLMDHKGRIFITSINNGFYVWHYSENRLIHYDLKDVDIRFKGETDNNLAPCVIDNKGFVWFTSTNGVYKWNPENGDYERINFEGRPGIPPIGASSFICQDKLGHYWISSMSNGLYELYYKDDSAIVYNYNTSSGIGLPADYCVRIKNDSKDSSLWISNINGVLRFDPIRKKVLSVLNQQRGFSSSGAGYSFTIAADNRFLQLFYGNLNIIDLNTYQWDQEKPAIIFSSVNVMGRDYKQQLDSAVSTLELNHKQNFIQIDFKALHYNNGNQIGYFYKLEPVESEWNQLMTAGPVTYAALEPGTYNFRVKAINADGLEGPERTIKMVIAKPFFRELWFIGLCIGVAVLLGWLFNRYKINQTRREEKIKSLFHQQIAETEMKALRAQMNPHFIFNSLNSIQKYILKNDHFEASQYLTKFSRLIRLILDHSNQDKIYLSSEIELLKLYVEMESLRFDNKFDYIFNIEASLQPETVQIPSMLIQPYVENAIWHGLLHKDEGGLLRISIRLAGSNTVIVEVDDDGIGRVKAAELKSKQVLRKKSYGMQITRDRLAIINQLHGINATCEIVDKVNDKGEGEGTRVLLVIPITK